MIARMYPLRHVQELVSSGVSVQQLPEVASFCAAHFYAGAPRERDVSRALDARRPSLALPAALEAEPTLAPFRKVDADTACPATTDRPVGTYNSFSIRVNAARPVLLFVRDGFSSYWKVRVDRVPSHVVPALGAFKAVVVPAGSHTVVFRFEPPWLKAALWMAYAALIALSVAVLGGRFSASTRSIRR